MALTKTQIEKELLSKLRLETELFQKKTDKNPNNAIERRDLKRLEKNFRNYEETTSIIVVHEIQRLLGLIYEGQNIDQQLGFGPIRMEKGDEVYAILSDKNKNNMDQKDKIWDSVMQQVYEELGYSEQLPTHEEIKALESQAKKTQDPVEKLKIEKEIELKKCKLGELDSWGLNRPTILAEDIERLYNERIAEAEKKEIMSDQKNEENETTTQIAM